jgi:hypothetical protein
VPERSASHKLGLLDDMCNFYTVMIMYDMRGHFALTSILRLIKVALFLRENIMLIHAGFWAYLTVRREVNSNRFMMYHSLIGAKPLRVRRIIFPFWNASRTVLKMPLTYTILC